MRERLLVNRFMRRVGGEMVVLILAFVILRTVAVVHSPVASADTGTYLQLDFLGGAERLWTIPLAYKLLPANALREGLQLIVGVVAWSVLAVTVYRTAAPGGAWLQRIAAIVVLLLGLAPQVTGWDFQLLSESLSTSLLVLLIALLLSLSSEYRPRMLIYAAVVLTLWIFTRQSNVILFTVLLPLVAVHVFRHAPFRSALGMTALLAVIALWGWVATLRNNEVERFNALQILENRVVPDAGALSFFEVRGLPDVNEIKGLGGALPGPLYRDAVLMHWVDTRFRSAYAAYLARNVFRVITKSFRAAYTSLSSGLTNGPTAPARVVLPATVSGLIWATTPGDVEFWLALALALVLLAASRTSIAMIRGMPLIGLLMSGVAVSIVLTWTLGASRDPWQNTRLAMTTSVALRIAILLMIVVSAQTLLGRRHDR